MPADTGHPSYIVITRCNSFVNGASGQLFNNSQTFSAKWFHGKRIKLRVAQ